ncbi:hypothetical protein JHK85_025738 [Glycine max]|nr:hypothetical protein JHK85_025738 [Glycine max]KAG5012977.1 hypothetical protein JHK86_025238 [Glycine max]
MHENQVMVEDLAGSERVAKTEVHGNRLKETQNINRSLSALGDLEKVKQEVKLKDLQMKKLEETIHGLESKMKERDNKNKNLQEKSSFPEVDGFSWTSLANVSSLSIFTFKVKEPESQLLVERKLARQHVDSKIVEQHQMKHQEKQNNTLLRLALASRPLGSLKNFNDPVNGGWFKDQQINSAKPLTKKIILKPCIPISTMETSIKCIDHAEKENNGDMADKALLPKRLGRPSICMMTPHVPSAVASRRNSLIRLPSIPSLTQFQSPLLPKLTNQFDQKDANGESETNCVLAQTHFLCPKEVRSGAKRIGSILRRSLHKKIQVKSPFQQHMRKVGVNVGMEKVRVSIGSRGDW